MSIQKADPNARTDERIKQCIREFIRSATSIRGLDDDDNLFESGIVSSLFAVQLMTFIERTFAIDVETDDLDMENFKSINAAAAFALRKSGGRGVAGGEAAWTSC